MAARKMHYIFNASAFTILRIMSLVGRVFFSRALSSACWFFSSTFSLLTLFICDILCKIICLFICLLSAFVRVFSTFSLLFCYTLPLIVRCSLLDATAAVVVVKAVSSSMRDCLLLVRFFR